MGCHTWTYASKEDYDNDRLDTAPHEFMFRVFDYQEDVLTSYEQAEKFVLETLSNSTNDKPPLNNEDLTHTGTMQNKILLAFEKDRDYEWENPTLTLKRLKTFFEKYPEGIIDFG